MKLSAPSALQNRGPILESLRATFRDSSLEELPLSPVRALEIASGTGEHALHFADSFPGLVWQPSEVSPQLVQSIAAHAREAIHQNVLQPLHLNILDPDATIGKLKDMEFQFIFCSNMFQVCERHAPDCFFKVCDAVLSHELGSKVFLYGPYLQGEKSAASNLQFHRLLQSRDETTGVHELDHIVEVAAQHGFPNREVTQMPTDNFFLSFSRE